MKEYQGTSVFASDWIASNGPCTIIFGDSIIRTRKSSFTKNDRNNDDKKSHRNSKNSETYPSLFSKCFLQFLIAFRIHASLHTNNHRYTVILRVCITQLTFATLPLFSEIKHLTITEARGFVCTTFSSAHESSKICFSSIFVIIFFLYDLSFVFLTNDCHILYI